MEEHHRDEPKWTARFLLLVACLAVLGCGPLPGRPRPGPEVLRPDQVVDFAQLYRENCSACHGAQGMNGPSYPLANPEYQAIIHEPQLHQVIANGEPRHPDACIRDQCRWQPD